MGKTTARNMLSWLELLLFSHLVGCLYYLYQWCTVKQISDNEVYLLIEYIKSVLWRVAKRLSYIRDAQCLKVNWQTLLSMSCLFIIILLFSPPPTIPHAQQNSGRKRRWYPSHKVTLWWGTFRFIVLCVCCTSLKATCFFVTSNLIIWSVKHLLLLCET